MRTDADDPACVRDPTIELLLGHTATLTDEWCSRPPVDNGLRTPARSDQRRSAERSHHNQHRGGPNSNNLSLTGRSVPVGVAPFSM